jgi:hypothetical protein
MKQQKLESQNQLNVKALVLSNEKLEEVFENLGKLPAKKAGPIAIMLSLRATGPEFGISATTNKVDCAWCFNPIQAKHPVYTIKIPRGITLQYKRMTSWNSSSRTLKIHPECIENIINQIEAISNSGN